MLEEVDSERLFMVNMLSHPRQFGQVLRKLSLLRRLPQFSTPCLLNLLYLNPSASRADILHGVLQGSNVVEWVGLAMLPVPIFALSKCLMGLFFSTVSLKGSMQ